MLSQDEIDRYREEGYLHLRGVFHAAEVDELREACTQASLRRELTERGYEERIVFLHPLTTKHPAFKAVGADARIVERIAALLGPDIQLQQSKLATKPPKAGKGAFHWHQDFAYFPHTNTDLLAVFVMLDDSTLENGCLHVAAGSHKLGLLDHTKDGRFSGGVSDAARCVDPARVVALEGKAGDVTIHHALTLHASFNNRSGRERRGLIYQYRAADAYQLDGRVFDDSGWQVRGCAPERIRCEAGTLPVYKRSYNGREFDIAWHQEGPAAKAWAGTEVRRLKPGAARA